MGGLENFWLVDEVGGGSRVCGLCMVMFCKYGRNEAKLMYIEFAAIAHRTPF